MKFRQAVLVAVFAVMLAGIAAKVSAAPAGPSVPFPCSRLYWPIC